MLYNVFIRFDDDKDFVIFKLCYFNLKSIEIFELSGVENCCINDMEFYLWLFCDELDKLIIVKFMLVWINNEFVEVKVKICIGGYCYESDEFFKGSLNLLILK